MKRILPQALVIASFVAVAGVAQADTFDSPQQAGEASTMTGGAPNARTTNSPWGDNDIIVDTRVLGSGPAVVTTYGTTTYGPTTYYYYSVSAPVVQPGVYGPRAYSPPQVGSYRYYGD
jgi:hypothetical protein